MTILGIETSCDETAACILKVKSLKNRTNFEIISNVVSSQILIHQKYGGIVPEVAARAHIEKILLVIKTVLNNKTKTHIDLIAVTNGPGLITSLLVGVETAKILSYIWKKPLISINHLKGHIYANWLCLNNINSKSLFPAICLIVSGGHTELVLMKNHVRYQKIGQTRDDAAGECFDKIAKLLNLGYPGGPVISKHAEKFHPRPGITNLKLPRPMIKSQNFDFSFSGLKTAVLYLTKQKKFTPINRESAKKLHQKARSGKIKFVSALCAEAQQAIIDVLISKTIRAAKKFNVKSVILCGGVAANKELRKQLESAVCSLPFKSNFYVPPRKFCTDNAAMIAVAAYFKYCNLTTKQFNNLKNNWQKIKVDPGLEI